MNLKTFHGKRAEKVLGPGGFSLIKAEEKILFDMGWDPPSITRCAFCCESR